MLLQSIAFDATKSPCKVPTRVAAKRNQGKLLRTSMASKRQEVTNKKKEAIGAAAKSAMQVACLWQSRFTYQTVMTLQLRAAKSIASDTSGMQS